MSEATPFEPLKIVYYPDPILTKNTRAITPAEIKSGKAGRWVLRDLVERMLVTMYEAEGIGLAAPQVGIDLRLFVVDISPDHDSPFCILNPELSEMTGAVDAEEGCLSIPDVRASVRRAERLVIKGLDLDGQAIEMEAENLLARVFQHEFDHLNGILFVQHIGTAARFMVRRALRDLEEDYEVIQRRRARSKKV